MSFAGIAINSSNLYYSLLKDQPKSRSRSHVIDVIRQSDGVYFFELDTGIRSVESVELEINGYKMHPKFYKILSYNSKKRIVNIYIPSKKLREKLDLWSELDIQFVVDFCFLIKRVENWYYDYGDLVKVPNKVSFLKDNAIVSPKASPEQAEAVFGAFNNPFAYVWGAPGTGKTKFVLAQCVLNYLKEGAHIIICAPTNNAVEQTLYGLISVLEESNFDYSDKMIRIGISSSEFADKYPKICENRDFVKEIMNIVDQINALNRELSKLNEMLCDIDDYNKFTIEKNIYYKFKEEIIEHYNTITPVKKEKKRLFLLLCDLDNKLESLNDEKSEQAKLLRELKIKKNDIKTEFEKFCNGLYRFVFKRRFYNLADDYAYIKNEYVEADKKYGEITEEINTAKTLRRQTAEEYKISAELFDKLKDRVIAVHKSLSKLYDRLMEISRGSSDFGEAEAEFEKHEAQLADKERTFFEIKDVNYDDISDRINDINEELSIYTARKQKIEMKEYANKSLYSYNVIACTVDSLISRISPTDERIKLNHIFLDEAGYCSLVKSAVLTAFDCPVTFFGDHKQLPPICNVKEKTIENNPSLVLWDHSALYCGQVLNCCGDNEIFDSIKTDLDFSVMKKYDLLYTYRFGESLAEILADEVYSENFHGNRNCNTELFYIDAVRMQGFKDRFNINECAAITEYIKKHHGEDIGIITPYRDQIKELRQFLNPFDFPDEDLVTVHGAQGREWDTVLFSVVDTKNMWFTDSNKKDSIGKCVINTALSRAKKRLIIVCDYDFWSEQHNQFIGKLLNLAEILELGEES